MSEDHAPARLAWHGGDRHGEIVASSEDTAVITLDGNDLLGIDLRSGRIGSWNAEGQWGTVGWFDCATQARSAPAARLGELAETVQSYRALSKELSALPSEHPQAEAGNQLLGAMSQYWPEDLNRFMVCEDTYRLRLAGLPDDSTIRGDIEACLRVTEHQVDALAKQHDDEKNRLQIELTGLLTTLQNATA